MLITQLADSRRRFCCRLRRHRVAAGLELDFMDGAVLMELGVDMQKFSASVWFSFALNSSVTSMRLFSISKFIRFSSSVNDTGHSMASGVVTIPKLSIVGFAFTLSNGFGRPVIPESLAVELDVAK